MYLYVYLHSPLHPNTSPPFPSSTQRWSVETKAPKGPARSPGRDDVGLLRGVQELHPGPSEAAQREHLQGDGKPPRRGRERRGTATGCGWWMVAMGGGWFGYGWFGMVSRRGRKTKRGKCGRFRFFWMNVMSWDI